MTDEKLIARLRDDSGNWLTDAAADRIEAVVKERDAANALLREAFDAGSDHGWDQAKQDECGGTEPLTPDEAFAAFLDAHLGAKP